MQSPREAAQGILYLALDEEVAGVTGKFFADFQTISKPALARDEDFCAEIWEWSEQCVKLQKHEKFTVNDK